MLILKYSYLNEAKTHVKFLEEGLYGIYNLEAKKIIIPAKYDYIFPFIGQKAVVVLNDKYFQIDIFGNEYHSILKYEEESSILKGDPCPNCYDRFSGSGCTRCMGLGFIPVKGDFDLGD